MCEAEARPKVRKDKRNFMISVRIESNIGSEKKNRWTLYITYKGVLSQRVSWGEGAWCYFIDRD
jgi:hypothetical protein